MSIVILGGTGYLGQWLLLHFAASHKVSYTYHSSAPVPFCPTATAYKVDFATGEGLSECLRESSPVAMVVNCAAISQPGVCEKDPELAERVNVPTALVAALQQLPGSSDQAPLLVHISTDQVYDGSKAMWAEGDPTEPVNAYGRSKLAAERFIQGAYANNVILRSSIIYGAPPPQPVPRALFLQFVDGAFAKAEPTAFFADEYRCPVYVKDIAAIVERVAQGALEQRLFNMGGPERLSRVDMAEQVADVRGYDKAKIQAVPSSSFPRGVKSPADISMDVARITAELGIRLTPFREALVEIFSSS